MLCEKTFIIKNSIGESYKYFFDNNKIIKQRIDISSDKPYTVIDNVYPYFYVCIDTKDQVHIICKNVDSEIVYLKKQENTWKKRIIVKTNDYTQFNNYFNILCFPDVIHFYYILKSKNKYILVFQGISDNKLFNSQIIDTVFYTSIPYAIHKDINNNVYIFYNPFDDDYKRIGYKIFDFMNNNWSNYYEISKSKFNYEAPFILIDNCNNINLLFKRQKDTTTNIIYQKIFSHQLPTNDNKNLEIILSSQNNDITNYFLMIIDNDLFAIWQNENAIFTCISIDNHFYWNKPSKYEIDLNENFKEFYYCSNYQDDNKRLIATKVFGNIEKSLNLFIINDFLYSQKNFQDILIENEEKDIMDFLGLHYNSLKDNLYKIAYEINRIKNEKSNIYNKYLDLSKVNYNLKNEISRLNSSIKYDEYEKDKLLKQVMALEKQIDSLNSLLNSKEQDVVKFMSENISLKQQLNNPRNKKLWSPDRLFNYFKKSN